MNQSADTVVPDPAVLLACVRAATLAPSIYNSQPWRFRVLPGRVDVYADTLRKLPAIDPDGREMHISLGAAVLNITVMLQAHHYAPHVDLLPDPAQPDLAASVSTGGEMSPTLHDLVLVAALTRRHTTRDPFTGQVLSEPLAHWLRDAACLEGAQFELLDDDDARALLALVRTADHGLREDPGYRHELAQWTTAYAGRSDGVGPESFGSPSLNDALPLRDFGAYQPWLDRRPEPFEPEPTIGVLSTIGDGPEHWLRAGMALERVLLEATIAGVAASFLTQPLEVPHLRRLYDERWPGRATQMVFRLGYPRRPVTTGSPRRPVTEVLMAR
jgi:hypothetical protein